MKEFATHAHESETQIDRISQLRLLKSELDGFKEESIKIAAYTFDTREGAEAAAMKFYEGWNKNHPEFGDVDALVAVSGEGILVPNYEISTADEVKAKSVTVSLSTDPFKPLDFFEERQGQIVGNAVATERNETTGRYHAAPTLVLKGDHPRAFTLRAAGLSTPLIAGSINVEETIFAYMSDKIQISIPELDDIDRQTLAASELAQKSIKLRRFVREMNKLHAAFFQQDYDHLQPIRSMDRLRWIAEQIEVMVDNKEISEFTVSEMLKGVIGKNRELILQGDAVTPTIENPIVEVQRKRARGTVTDVFLHKSESDELPTAYISLNVKNQYGPPQTEWFAIKELEAFHF